MQRRICSSASELLECVGCDWGDTRMEREDARERKGGRGARGLIPNPWGEMTITV